MHQYHVTALRDLTTNIHSANVAAGWWTDKAGNPLQANPFAFSNKLALCHSELSEALEGDRKGKQDDHLPHRLASEVELADALIRIFDLAGAYDLDVAGAMYEKIAYNAQRADHKAATRSGPGGKAY